MDDLDASALLRRARRAAGLSQRRLAERAGTSQSVVARIESGSTDPSTETLSRLLAASGFALRCVLLRMPGGPTAVQRRSEDQGRLPDRAHRSRGSSARTAHSAPPAGSR